jgi:nicotinamidase-related amidase
MTLSTLDARTALVLIDLQAGTVARPTVPHPAAEVVVRGRELADAFRGYGLPVVLVNVVDGAPGRTELDLAGDDDDDTSDSGNTADSGDTAEPVDAADDANPENAETSEDADAWSAIVPGVGAVPSDLRVSKRSWGAFHGTDLDTLLRRRGVTHIVLAGLMTSIGVETTARDAYAHGYHVTLATDAMADWTIEAHERSVELVFPRLGERGRAAEIVALLDRTR